MNSPDGSVTHQNARIWIFRGGLEEILIEKLKPCRMAPRLPKWHMTKTLYLYRETGCKLNLILDRSKI